MGVNNVEKNVLIGLKIKFIFDEIMISVVMINNLSD